LFEKNKTPLTQNALLAAPLVMSKEIRDQGGLYQSTSFTGVYSKEELTEYFESLKDSILNSDPAYTQPVALVLQNSNHAISVGFDPIENQWIFIDANNIPTQYLSNDER